MQFNPLPKAHDFPCWGSMYPSSPRLIHSQRKHMTSSEKKLLPFFHLKTPTAQHSASSHVQETKPPNPNASSLNPKTQVSSSFHRQIPAIPPTYDQDHTHNNTYRYNSSKNNKCSTPSRKKQSPGNPHNYCLRCVTPPPISPNYNCRQIDSPAA